MVRALDVDGSRARDDLRSPRNSSRDRHWAGPALAAGSAVTGSDLGAAVPPQLTAVAAKEVAQRYGQYPDDAFTKVPQIKEALRRLYPSFLETVTDPNGHEALITGPGVDNRAVRMGNRDVLLVSSCKRANQCDATWFVLAYDAQSSAVALLTETDQPHRFVLFGNPDPTLRALLFSTAAQDMNEAAQGPAPPIAIDFRVLKDAAYSKFTPGSFLQSGSWARDTDRLYGPPATIATNPRIAGAARQVAPNISLPTAFQAAYSGLFRSDRGRQLLVLYGTTADHATGSALVYDVAANTASLVQRNPDGSYRLYGAPDVDMRTVLFSGEYNAVPHDEGAAHGAAGATSAAGAGGATASGTGTRTSPPAGACRPPLPGEPAPGRYVRVKAPKMVLTIASGCTTPSTLADPKGNVQAQSVIGNEADQGTPGLPAAAFLAEMSVCAGYVLKQSDPNSVHLTWASELTGSGRRDCGGVASIEGDYARVP